MTDSGKQRIFIGVPVDGEAQSRINVLLKSMRESHPDIRWVPEGNRHLTLAFLGDVAVSVVNDLVGSFDEIYGKEQSSRLELTRLTRFPKPNSRIVALTGEGDSSVDKLFQNTSRLLRSVDQPVDSRPFLPHVTLARFKRKSHSGIRLDLPVNVRLNVVRIRLYRSTLTESGPLYSVLKETRLTSKI